MKYLMSLRDEGYTVGDKYITIEEDRGGKFQVVLLDHHDHVYLSDATTREEADMIARLGRKLLCRIVQRELIALKSETQKEFDELHDRLERLELDAAGMDAVRAVVDLIKSL